MKFRAVLIVSAIYQAIVGVGMMLVPRQFGIGAVPPDASPALLHFLRIFGGPMLGIAVLNWMARNAKHFHSAKRHFPCQYRGVWLRNSRGRMGCVHWWRAPDSETVPGDSFAFDCRLRRCMADQPAGPAQLGRTVRR